MTVIDIDNKKLHFNNIINNKYNCKKLFTTFRNIFDKNGYVCMSDFFTKEFFEILKLKIHQLKNVSLQRNFIMEEYNSPRKMRVLGADLINQYSPDLIKLYFHYKIRTIIEKIVGHKIYDCNHFNEYMVINYLTGIQSTHGWHLDDPAFALVIFIKSANDPDEGKLQFIPNWDNFKNKHVDNDDWNNIVIKAKNNTNFIEHTHSENMAYLLRADRHLHRVTELKDKTSERIVINMAFEEKLKSYDEYGKTADKLYNKDYL